MALRRPASFIVVLLILTIFFSGCEGFKALTLYNTSGREIIVQTKPELPVFKASFPDTVQNLVVLLNV